jgi:hypothetical protein
MNNKISWICIRCNKVCAPHIDYCDCKPTELQSTQYIPTPYINPLIPQIIPYQPFIYYPNISCISQTIQPTSLISIS